MWSQIRAITWAQFRLTRNHLPRTNVGAVLLGLFSLVWYGGFITLAVLLAVGLQSLEISKQQIGIWLPPGLLGVFTFWQLVPLFTLSGGWSLQLKKLLPFPLKDSTLFGIEVLLRVTTAPEMIILLIGALVGLLLRPDVGITAFALLLFIPLNLFLSLAIREVVLQAFARNKFREIFTVLIVSIGVLPQILIRTPLGHRVKPYALLVAHGSFTPWREVSVLSLGTPYPYVDVSLVIGWTWFCYWLARRQFEKGVHSDVVFRAGSSADDLTPGRARRASPFQALADLPNRLFQDPLAALIQKEYRSLLRMPRFRVMFGMACVFSVIVFIPMTLNQVNRHGTEGFMSNNFLVVTTLYGVLILSDSLLLNVFGFDRAATQIYFVSPISFRSVLVAKNLTAITFVALQSLSVLIVAAVVRIALTPINVLNAVAAAAVVGVFFLSAGNVTSVSMARPLNPAETFRKQAGGKMQLWLLLCAMAMCVLVGFGFLARWALDNNWAMLIVLIIEFVVGYIIYRVALESAMEKATEERERLIDALSKGAGASVLGVGIS